MPLSFEPNHSRSTLADLVEAPNFMNVNYANKDLWSAFYGDEIEELKQSVKQGISSQEINIKLTDLQSSVGRLTLSPVVYSLGLLDLQKFIRAEINKPELYLETIKEVRRKWRDTLRSEKAFALENFATDVLGSVSKVAKGLWDAQTGRETLAYYYGILPHTCYQATVDLAKGFIENFAEHYDENGVRILNVVTKQDYYETLEKLRDIFNDAVSQLPALKTNKEALLSSQAHTLPKAEKSYTEKAWTSIKDLGQYVIEHPGTTTAIVLGAQAISVAALESLQKSSKYSSNTGESNLVASDLSEKQWSVSNNARQLKNNNYFTKVTSHYTAQKSVKRAYNTQFQVNQNTADQQQYPAIASLDNGNAVVAWESNLEDSSGTGIYARLMSPDGSHASNPFKVNTDVSGNQKNPAVSKLANSYFVVVWEGVGGADAYGIYGQMYKNTLDINNKPETHGVQFLINTPTSSAPESKPKVSKLSNDNFVVVWTSNYGMYVYGKIFSTTLDGNNAPSSGSLQFNIVSGPNWEVLYSPDVTGLSTGNFVTMWSIYETDNYGTASHMYGKMYVPPALSTQSPTSVTSFTADNLKWEYQSDSTAIIRTCDLTTGNFVVVWDLVADNSGYGIYGQMLSPTINATTSQPSKIGYEFLVNSNTAALDQTRPAIAALPAGDFVVVWQGNGANDVNGIFGQRFSSTDTNNKPQQLGNYFLINDNPSEPQSYPDVAVLNSGDLIVVWQSTGSTGTSEIYGKVMTLQAKATNINQAIGYTEDASFTLAPIAITPPFYETSLNVLMTLSNATAGSLSGSPYGSATINYSAPNLQIAGLVADVNQVLTGIQFIPVGNATGSFTIPVSIKDGANANILTSGTMSVTCTTPVNDRPDLSGGGNTLAYTEKDTAKVINSGIIIDDIDSTNLINATVTIKSGYVSGQDVLACTTQTGLTSCTFNSATGVLPLLGITSKTNYQNALQGVTYRNLSYNVTTTPRTIEFRVNDGGSVNSFSNIITSSVTVTAVNDNPTLNSTVTTINYNENATPQIINSAIIVDDVDSNTFLSATVAIRSNEFRNQEDVLACTTPLPTGITTCTFSNVTGVLTLGNSATKASYQTALRQVTYKNLSDNPTTTPRTIDFQVSDNLSASSNVLNSTVGITSSNDAPVLNGTTTATNYTEGSASIPVDGALLLSDIDNSNMASATVVINPPGFNSTQDVLEFTDQNGILGLYDSVTGILNLIGSTVTGNYQSALRTVKYKNTSNNPSDTTRVVSFTVFDSDNAPSNKANRTINIIPVNNQPQLTGSTTNLGYTENNPPIAICNNIALTDVDSNNMNNASVAITNGFAGAEDVLACTMPLPTGITICNFNNATGILTLGNSAPKASYQAALRNVTYINTSDNPFTTNNREISITVSDGIATSDALVRNIAVTALNDKPQLEGSTSAITYIESNPPLAVCDDIALTDVDNSQVTNALVSITNGFISAEDVLACSSLPGGITANYNTATGVLTLSGNSSKANYQTALRNVTYVNNSSNPSTGSRTIGVTVNDGTDISDTFTRSISIIVNNNEPQLTGSSTAITYTENAQSFLVCDDIIVTDLDSNNMVGASISVTSGFSSNEDQLTCNPPAGISANYNNISGVLTLSGTASKADYQTALRNIHYQNSSDNPSTTSRVIVITVNDGSTDSNTFVRTIQINSVNDQPELVNHQLTVQAGQSVILSTTNFSATDKDNAAASLQFIISELSNGYFEKTSAAGTPIVNFTQQELSDGIIRFVPTGSTAPSFKVQVSDGIGGNTTPTLATISYLPLTTTATTTSDSTSSSTTSDSSDNGSEPGNSDDLLLKILPPSIGAPLLTVCAAGIGFFAKRYRNKQLMDIASQQAHLFASVLQVELGLDISNFSSVKEGVAYVNEVDKLVTQLKAALEEEGTAIPNAAEYNELDFKAEHFNREQIKTVVKYSLLVATVIKGTCQKPYLASIASERDNIIENTIKRLLSKDPQVLPTDNDIWAMLASINAQKDVLQILNSPEINSVSNSAADLIVKQAKKSGLDDDVELGSMTNKLHV